MKSRTLKKTLSVFLSLMMLLTALAVGVVPLRASAAADTDTLLGRYFSTDNVWYNAARRQNGLSRVEGNSPAYDAASGGTFIDTNYFRFESDIFSGVSQDTGLTFAFEYTPQFASGDQFRHILSIGKNAYGNGTANHLFISGAHTQHSSNIFQVTWVNGSGNELINAYAADVPQVEGRKYNVVVTIDKDAGVVFFVDGAQKETVYVNSSLSGQIGHIRSFLGEVSTYQYNYFGCSRWTSDRKIRGYLKDFRIYKSVASSSEVSALAAGVAGTGNPASGLVGRYYTTDDPWYNAVTGKDSVRIHFGSAPVRHAAGFSYMNNSIYQLETDLFKNVTQDTGVTFSFNYRPNFGDRHRHLISIGQRAYGDGTANHFFISGAYAHNSDGKMPLVEWVNGSGGETIAAYPAGVAQEKGREYNIVVSVDKDAGIVFYVDGEKKETIYAGSSLNDQLGNIRSFLDEVHTYTYNYVGCSRWTGDAKIDGSVSDLRVYQTSVDEEAAYNVIFDMIGTSFNLDQPSFNATAYHYNETATGGYSNLAYTSGENTTIAPDAFTKVERMYYKLFTPASVVMVFDGAEGHTPSFPIQLEQHADLGTASMVKNHHIRYVASTTSNLGLKQYWQATLDGNYGNAWEHWSPNINNWLPGQSFSNTTSQESDNDDRNNTNRYYWNAVTYTGQGDNESFYTAYGTLSYTTKMYCSWTGGSGSFEGTVNTSEGHYYVLNYKPVYDILNAASNKYSNEMSGKKWMYTEASYAQAMLAMRRLTLCNPNLYNYGADVDKAAQICADAIKYAKADYDVVNLVKKTATVHINEGAGVILSVTNNGTALTNGATVNYGDTVTATASAISAYDQSSPTVTITGGSVSGNSTLVNEPDIYVSSNDLSLNTYTLTFDPNGGTLSGDASVTATYTQPLPAAPQANRNGYIFQRYLYSAGSSDYTYYNQSFENVHGNYDVKGDVTVTAQWSPANYAITFVPNGGTIDASALTNFGGTYTVEDTKTLPTATAPTGYHFDGWTVAATNVGDSHGWGTDKIAENAAVTGCWGNVMLTATYAPNTDTAYAVEYYEMGTDGAYPAAATRTENLTGTTGETAAAVTTAPTGFTFDSTNTGNVLSSPIAADGSTVLRVYLSRNQYTVTVTLGEGAALNVADGAQYYYGETVTFTASALTGYDPASISLTVNDSSAANGSSFTVEDNIAVEVGSLSKLQLTVTVTAGTGSEITGITEGTYDYGTVFSGISAVALEGYNAAGLKLRANGNVVERPYGFTLTADMNLTTDDLNKLQYTVTAAAGVGATISGAGTYNYGDSVTVTAVKQEGYDGEPVLKMDGAAVTNPYTFNIYGDHTFTTDDLSATVFYTVVFNNYDNTKLYETTVAAGDSVIYPYADPEKPAEGFHTFTFAGWNGSLEEINETTVFTAQFNTVHSYTVQGYDAALHYMTCKECGEIDESTRQTHVLTTVTDATAACNTDGLEHDECSLCDYASDQRNLGKNASNHESVAPVDAVAANCVTEGFTAGTYCSACNTYVSGHESLGYDVENGHAYGDFTSDGNGTTHTKRCTREGCAERNAENGYAVSENCSGGDPATCRTKSVCSVCREAYGTFDETNHENVVDVPAVTANCVTEGFTAGRQCTVCGEFTVAPESLGFNTVNGHAYGDFISDGNGTTHTKRCTREGCAEANAENGYAVTENCSGGDPATCRTKSVCSVCREAYGTFDETNHENVVDVPAVAANCVTEGFTAGRQCTVCGEFTVEPESLGYDTVNGHAYGDFTSDNNGATHTKRCTREGCAERNAENGYAVSENCSGGDPATCNVKSVCSVCHASYGNYSDHVYGDWNKPQEPNCCNEGWVGYYQCSVCEKYFDAAFTEIDNIVIAIDPDAHVYDYSMPDEDASTRPVYDEASGEWSTGTLVYHCLNTAALDPDTGYLTYDTTHDKVIEDLERADYSVFDEEAGKIRSITDLDLDPDATVRMLNENNEYEDVPVSELLDEIGLILDFIDDFPLDLITSDDPAIDEQPMIDEFVEGFDEIIAIFFNTDGTPKEALLNHYTVTFTLKNGTKTTYADQLKDAVVDVPAAPAEVDGYAFLGWTLDGTSIALASDATEYTVTGDAAFTAKYADTPTNCTVTFLKADGTELSTVTVAYGATLADNQIPGIPAKDADDVNHYIGSWDAEIVTTVTVDATYQAVYTPKAHTGGTASCTEQAICEVCDTPYGELAAHQWSWVTDLDPTCGTPGKKHQKCNNCTAIQALDTEIEPTGEHSFTVLQSDENGHWYKCENCTAVTASENHTGGTASCTEQAKCSVCDTPYGELAAHQWSWVTDLDPTCGTPGKKHQKCNNCTATQAFDTEIEPTGEHSFTVLQSDENSHWYKCENCTAVTASENHTGGTASCTEQAKCSVCDTPYGELADHSWGWVNDEAPTCGEAGVRHEECSVCHITRSEGSVAPATGNHTPAEATVENSVNPTCTAGGSYDSVVICSVCGNEISRTHVTVGALGHDFGEWTETAHPTCTDAGEKQRTCSRCPETETETVPALGHDYTAWTTVTSATCTDAGSEARGCTRCDLAETRTVAALGHSWGAWVVITEPTFETDGLRRRDCDRCDAYEEEVLAYSGDANRQIQFVVSGDMHYVVHLRDSDYEIYSRTTPAIRWYDNTALTFDVHTHSGWGDKGVIVSLNGEELKPNADGSYTIPGGTGYVKINAYAGDSAASSDSGDVCSYCGKVHPNSLWGRIVAFFHLIFWFFKNLFRR